MTKDLPDDADRAVRAAVEVAEEHGAGVTEPVVLDDGYNVVVWLRPAPVVARVVLLPALLRSRVDLMIARELAVTEFLARRGVPVVSPTRELPAGPHERRGLWLSFWEHLDVDSTTADPVETGALLRRLHTALRDYTGNTATLDVATGDVEAFLRDEHGDASRDELALVRARFDKVLPEVLGREPVQQLHGDAHPGNLLRTPRGWVWADFEECMRGPVEWDLAILADTDRLDGATALEEYGADVGTLEPFRMLRRLQAACWYQVLAQRFPDRRARARELLDRLR